MVLGLREIKEGPRPQTTIPPALILENWRGIFRQEVNWCVMMKKWYPGGLKIAQFTASGSMKMDQRKQF